MGAVKIANLFIMLWNLALVGFFTLLYYLNELEFDFKLC